MLIEELMRKGIEVVPFDVAKGEYDIIFKRPGTCTSCNRGRASKLGRTAYRKILDADKTGIRYLFISVPRFRCNQCREYMHSEDEAILESLLSKKAVWTNDAIVFMIRHLLADSECKYAYLEKKYGVSQGSLCEEFRKFRESVQKDISPFLKCEQMILWPIQDRDGNDVCIFGIQGGQIGLMEIGKKEDIMPFLEWTFNKTFPQQVICDDELANAIDLASLYPNYALTQKSMAEFRRWIASHFGNDFLAQLQAIDVHAEDCDERVDRLCDTIYAKSAIEKMALGDDIREYIEALRRQIEYDEAYIKAEVAKIIDLRFRQYDDADIVLRSIFTSSLHRYMLRKTEYAKYVIE